MKTVVLDVTNRCNLNCSFCDQNEGANKDLSIEQIKEVANWSDSTGLENIILLGGEPVLHPDYDEIVEILNEKGLSISVQTNGASVNDVDKYGDVESVVVSLDGFKKRHDSNRGEGVFDKAVDTIHDLSKKNGMWSGETYRCDYCSQSHVEPGKEFYSIGPLEVYDDKIYREHIEGHGESFDSPSVGVRLTYHKDNFGEVLKLAKYFSQQTHGVYLFPLLYDPMRELSRQQIMTLYGEISKIDGARVGQATYNYFLGMEHTCRAGTERFSVKPDGTVYDCYWLQNKIGELSDDIEVILEAGKQMNESQPVPPECAICENADYCKGGCRAIMEEKNCPIRSGYSASKLVENNEGLDMQGVNSSRQQLQDIDLVVC